jgi:ABC-2 type transport system permease protein
MEDNFMIKEIKFALYSIKKNIQSSTELRTSFLMNVVGMAINNTAFVFLWIYFVKSVGVIGGWTAFDIIGLNGFASITYGITFSVFMGIRKIPEYVTLGSFDRFLLSPKNILLRIATSSFSPSAVGDVVFGIICLIIYGFLIKISLLQIIFVFFLIIFASIIFLALAIIISTVSFYFIDARSISDGMFQLFFTPTLFHGGAFQGVMRFIFVFIIPSLLIATVPTETVKNISFINLILVGLASLLWLFISIKLFNKAIRKYESSSFMTFGN